MVGISLSLGDVKGIELGCLRYGNKLKRGPRSLATMKKLLHVWLEVGYLLVEGVLHSIVPPLHLRLNWWPELRILSHLCSFSLFLHLMTKVWWTCQWRCLVSAKYLSWGISRVDVNTMLQLPILVGTPAFTLSKCGVDLYCYLNRATQFSSSWRHQACMCLMFGLGSWIEQSTGRPVFEGHFTNNSSLKCFWCHFWCGTLFHHPWLFQITFC